MNTGRVCLAILILIFLSSEMMSQLSPGKLSEAHKDLEGLSNCTQCHDFGNKVPDFKCLACHDEIDRLIKNNKGYHASTQYSKKNASTVTANTTVENLTWSALMKINLIMNSLDTL